MRKADTLTAVLAGSNLRNDLCGYIARCGKRVGLFNHRAADNGAVLKHIFQIYKITVVHMLRKVIGVMEMNQPVFMRLHNILRQKDSLGQVFGNFTRHVIALYAVYSGILV